jgi:hypothetical protein
MAAAGMAIANAMHGSAQTGRNRVLMLFKIQFLTP